MSRRDEFVDRQIEPEHTPEMRYLRRRDRIWACHLYRRRVRVLLLRMARWRWYERWATASLDVCDDAWNDNDTPVLREDVVIPGPWSCRPRWRKRLA